MISKLGSLQSSQATTQARKVEAQPVESRPRNTNTETAAPRAAAVVQIGGQARALAAQAEATPQSRIAELGAQRAQSPTQSAARPRLGESSEARTEIEIEPVVAQPVPDFSASREVSAPQGRSVYSSGAASETGSATQASSSGRSYVA
jgi:hypothetical protein